MTKPFVRCIAAVVVRECWIISDTTKLIKTSTHELVTSLIIDIGKFSSKYASWLRTVDEPVIVMLRSIKADLSIKCQVCHYRASL